MGEGALPAPPAAARSSRRVATELGGLGRARDAATAGARRRAGAPAARRPPSGVAPLQVRPVAGAGSDPGRRAADVCARHRPRGDATAHVAGAARGGRALPGRTRDTAHPARARGRPARARWRGLRRHARLRAARLDGCGSPSAAPPTRWRCATAGAARSPAARRAQTSTIITSTSGRGEGPTRSRTGSCSAHSTTSAACTQGSCASPDTRPTPCGSSSDCAAAERHWRPTARATCGWPFPKQPTRRARHERPRHR